MFFTKKEKEKYEKKIAELTHEVKELSEIVKTQELIRLRAENQQLKEKVQLMSHVHLRLKDVAYIAEEQAVLVKYEAPWAKVFIDNEGKVSKNDYFFAINKLQILSFDDMKKIQKVIDNTKAEILKNK